MFFQRITNVDKQVLSCFLPCRNCFIYSSKSAIKQLKRIIKTSYHFFKVFDNNVFIGCLFVDNIDHLNKVIEFGGFAFRHVNTKQSLKELIAYLKYHYPDYTLKALTKQKTAKFSLARVGFINRNGEYIYDQKKRH